MSDFDFTSVELSMDVLNELFDIVVFEEKGKRCIELSYKRRDPLVLKEGQSIESALNREAVYNRRATKLVASAFGRRVDAMLDR